MPPTEVISGCAVPATSLARDQSYEPSRSIPPLLQLVAEVRTQIWTYVLSNSSLVIYIRDGHLAHEPRSLARQRLEGQYQRSPPPGERVNTSNLVNPVQGPGNKCFSLIFVNRQIYFETIGILYQRINFHFRSRPVLISFMSKTTNAFHWLRRLSITWIDRKSVYNKSISENDCYLLAQKDCWAEIWGLVAKMKGLRELSLNLRVNRHPFTYNYNKNGGWELMNDYLRGLKKNVRGIERFEMRLRLPSGENWGFEAHKEEIKRLVCRPSLPEEELLSSETYD